MRPLALARLAGMTAALVLAATAPARALLLTINPRVAVGVTNNAYGATDDQSVKQYRDEYGSAGISSALVLNLARSNHRIGYGFNTTRYLSYQSADVTTHDALWASTFNLTAHTTLGLGANASIFRASAVAAVDPMMMNVGVVTFTQAPTSILTASVSQFLGYEPSGVDKYTEAASASIIRSFETTGGVPELLQLNTTLRRERTFGHDTYSLSVAAGDFFRLDTPPPSDQSGSFATGHVVSGTLLGGWRREFSARTATDIQAGFMALYGSTTGSVAVGPAGIATLSYRMVPWFATLVIAQQPSVNIFVGEAVVADSATLRVSLPVNRRETFLVAGFGTYTYARRVTGDQHFVFASRVYDLVSLGASLIYRFERWPIGIGLDYMLSSQHGSNADGRYYPSTARSTLGLSISGTLAFGEGNAGWLRPR